MIAFLISSLAGFGFARPVQPKRVMTERSKIAEVATRLGRLAGGAIVLDKLKAHLLLSGKDMSCECYLIVSRCLV